MDDKTVCVTEKIIGDTLYVIESAVSSTAKETAYDKLKRIAARRHPADYRVRKYTDIQELTAEMIREFVERIYVYKTERVDGRRVQRIKIVWNCIGKFTPPVSTSAVEQEKSA